LGDVLGDSHDLGFLEHTAARDSYFHCAPRMGNLLQTLGGCGWNFLGQGMGDRLLILSPMIYRPAMTGPLADEFKRCKG